MSSHRQSVLDESPDTVANHPAHLTKHARDIGGHPRFTGADLSAREWFCEDCGSRITRSPDAEREYGHQRSCPHKLQLDSMPGNGGSR